MLKHGLTLLLCALVALSGCKRRDSTPPPPKNQADTNSGQSGGPSFDACKLLTNQEIEAIESAPVKDAKNSGRSDGGFSFAQCFYTTDPFNKSVSLAITLSDPTTQQKRSVKEYWEGMFAKYEHDGKEREEGKAENEADKEKAESLRKQRGERGEEGEGAPPKKITGVGDEAYWIGNRVGGALYVLRKDAMIRVSVGGPDPEQGKIDKCKALAEKALNKL